jgi:hypothetical protein
MSKPKKLRTTSEFTRDELFAWCCERVLESLMYGRFREGMSMAFGQIVVWAREQERRGK